MSPYLYGDRSCQRGKSSSLLGFYTLYDGFEATKRWQAFRKQLHTGCQSFRFMRGEPQPYGEIIDQFYA